MNLAHITVLIITLDEIDNIERLLQDLHRFPRVLVIDSGSTDGTLECIRRFSNTTTIHRSFDSFAGQCNAALTGITTPWVLSLDADYRITDALVSEIESLVPEHDAYWCRFKFAIQGEALRATLLPPRPVLFQSHLRYVQDGHAHRLEGWTYEKAHFRNAIIHDDRKSLGRWLRAQWGYALNEVGKFESGTPLSLPDRIRTWIVVAPWLVPLHALLVRGLLMDGYRGLHYAFQRAIAESVLSLALLDSRLRNDKR